MSRETNKDGEQLIDIVERHEKQIHLVISSQGYTNEANRNLILVVETQFKVLKILCFAIAVTFAFVTYKTWGL